MDISDLVPSLGSLVVLESKNDLFFASVAFRSLLSPLLIRYSRSASGFCGNSQFAMG